jgi:hypothetical protein
MSQVLGAWIYILMRLESIGFMGYPWASTKKPTKNKREIHIPKVE